MTWLSQGAPLTNGTTQTFWASIAHMVGNSNFRNPNVPTRPMPSPVGMPQQWQPPLTSATSADAALKGMP